MEKIWWNQITRASRLVHTVSEVMLDGRSVILSMPAAIPWYQTMYQQIEEELRQGNPNNSLQAFPCPESSPGEYLLENYCKREKRADFRRNTSYAAFLAKSEDLVLNHRYLWVRDVSRDKLEEWRRFITAYNNELPKGVSHAVFLLETSEDVPRKAMKGIQTICFSNEIDSYDRFAFCALASTEVDIPLFLRPYLAEMVSNLCQDDVELCAACMQYGRTFLEEPERVLADITARRVRSDGQPFCTEPVLNNLPERVWESQLKLIFPVLQRYTAKLIRKHEQDIRRALPITTLYNIVIDDPQDMDLGPLKCLADRKQIMMTPQEYDRLLLFLDARNCLAHMRPAKLSHVEKILSAPF